VLVLASVALAIALWIAIDAFRGRAQPVPAPPEPAAPAPPDLDELAREVEQSPSFSNRVRMGWALLHARKPEPAQRYFEQALATHPKDKHALYGLGVSQLEQGASDDAVKTLSRLVERSFAYEDYEAALALVEAHVRAGQNELAQELLAAVAQDSGRLEHQLALARHHVKLAQRSEAQDILRSALRLFDTQPAFLRQRNGAAATEARRLLHMLEQ
jgi:tetratricopeptide (TPR) repeat protein